jgi:hypothetical protein
MEGERKVERRIKGREGESYDGMVRGQGDGS